jgi:2-haloacid dehalogenase
MPIKALVFDVFGTLVDWRSGVTRDVERLLARDHPDLDGASFADAWRARYQPSMEDVRTGRGPGSISTPCTAKVWTASWSSSASR